jgi:hypothetical protein
VERFNHKRRKKPTEITVEPVTRVKPHVVSQSLSRAVSPPLNPPEGSQKKSPATVRQRDCPKFLDHVSIGLHRRLQKRPILVPGNMFRTGGHSVDLLDYREELSRAFPKTSWKFGKSLLFVLSVFDKELFLFNDREKTLCRVALIVEFPSKLQFKPEEILVGRMFK